MQSKHAPPDGSETRESRASARAATAWSALLPPRALAPAHLPYTGDPAPLWRQTVSGIGHAGGNLTGRGIRDAPERAWPRICKIPGEVFISGTCWRRTG